MLTTIPNFIINNHQLFLAMVILSVFLSVYSPLASFVLTWGKFGQDPLQPLDSRIQFSLEQAFHTFFVGLTFLFSVYIIVSFISSTTFPPIYDVPRFVFSILIGFLLVGFYMYMFSIILPLTYVIVNAFPPNFLNLALFPFLNPFTPMRIFIDNALTIFFLNIMIAAGSTFFRKTPSI